MSNSVIGALRVMLGMDTAEFEAGTDRAARESKRLQKQMEQTGKRMQKIGTGLTAAITLPIAAFGKTALDAAIQSREAFAQVEQALATMGGASGKTAAELQKTAKQLETFSNFDDDDILQKVTANLLTFGNVSGEQFDRAQQAAVDLSARLGQDLQSSAIQLGKALNDPVKGITALSRVGVSFTADQKAMIKSMAEAGDIAGAQTLILAELEKQYGGAAKAAREAAPGGDQAQAWRTLQEVIGERLVLAFEKLEKIVTPIINRFLEMDETTQTVIVVIAALAAAIGPALIVLGTMASGISALIALGAPLVAAFGAIKVAALALMTNPAILAFAAVVTGIYLAWQHWDKIEPIIRRLYEGAKRWLKERLGPIFDWVVEKISAVTGFFKDMYVAVVGNSYVPDMVDQIGQHFARLDGLMIDPARRAAKGTADAMREMARETQAILAEAFPDDARRFELAQKLKAFDAAADSLDLSDGDRARGRLNLQGNRGAGPLSPELQALMGSVKDQIVTIPEDLRKAADRTQVQTVRIAETFQQMTDRALGALRRLTDGIRQGDFLSILEGVLGIFSTLGGTGLFGKTIQQNLQRTPGFANGGAMRLGGFSGIDTNLLSLNGSPIARVSRGETMQITPANDRGSGGATVINNYYTLPSNEFWGQVDGRAAGVVSQAAPAIASGGATIAQGQMAQRARRRFR